MIIFKFDTLQASCEKDDNPFLSIQQNEETLFDMNSFIAREEECKTTFLVTKGPEKNMLGGAWLLKKSRADIQELIDALTSEDSYVWVCSHVQLEFLSHQICSDSPDFVKILQIFYRDLYESLVEFGKKESISFLIIKLSEEAYRSTKKFGLWPYVVELKPHHSQDGFFHGILPLVGSQYESFQERWKGLEIED